MKAQLMGLLLVVVACEGEPPKMASAPVGLIPTPPEDSAEAPTPPPTTPPPCACQCGCGTAPAAAGDAAVAAAEDAGVAEAAAPPAVTHGAITGTVTTTPANLAAVSVVYLEDGPKESTRGMTARVDNRQMAFTPFVQVIAQGGSVTFVNSDPFPHNVFSPDHEGFNIGAVPQLSTSAPHKFTHTGAYSLLCNLHPNMLGYVLVVPSGYFAKTDSKGRYRITDVPVGTYKVTAWAPRLPTVTQSVTLTGEEAKSDFDVHR